ncbi:MAG: phage late control D family protein [Plesiomonas sp.]
MIGQNWLYDSNTPAYHLTLAGKDITTNIESRLISLTLTDNRGFEADMLDIELDDADGMLELPNRGVSITLALGWKGQALTPKGSFTVDAVEHSGAPDKLIIRASSADFRDTLNLKRDASYHNIKLGDIVTTIAKRNKLDVALDSIMAEIHITHIDQTNESDGSFLTRLAKQEGAIASVKAGKLLFIRQGQGQTASGKPLQTLMLTRQKGDTHRFSIADRDAYTGVIAHWLNTRDPQKKEQVKVNRKASSKPKKTTEKQGDYLVGTEDNVLVLGHTYASEENAARAAKNAWQKLQRGVATLSIQLAQGRADIYPEMPVITAGFKTQIDTAKWLLTTVAHSVTDSGYTNALELEVMIDDLGME